MLNEAACDCHPNPCAPRIACSPLAEILQSGDVLLGLDAGTAEQALSGIARFMASRHGLSAVAVRAALAGRERLGSTALGCGVAIPHARLKDLSRPVAAFVRMALPVSFDAPDGKPVGDMLVLLVPWAATEEHLVILAEVATMFSHNEFRVDLRACTDREQVYAMLARMPFTGDAQQRSI